MPRPWPSCTLGAMGGALTTTPQPGSGQQDHLLAWLDIVHFSACSQQLREEACSACQEGSGFNPQFQEALSAAPPTSHSPGILGLWGGGLAGVHGVFPVAGLPPPRTVDSPGPTFSSGQGQISAWQPGGLSWALGAPCPAALPSSIERRGLLPGPSQWSDHSGPLPAPPHPPPGWSSASTASHLQGGLCFSRAGTLLLPACLWETWTPIPTQHLPGPGAAEASPPHLCHQPLA